MEMSITLAIVIITCGISITGFYNQKVIDDLIFYPPAITNRKQWYRFITHGFIHANIPHLAFNMFALYSFGTLTEKYIFSNYCVFWSYGKALYLILYILGIVVASIPTYLKNKDNYHYKSLGASGAVSGVMFATLVLIPQIPIQIIFIPIGIPGFIMGPLFLIISAYLAKRGGDNINHSAHFWGAAFGFVFTLVLVLVLSKINVLENFMDQLKAYPKILRFEC
jgi:membrane associated rhomboid family serine protease